MCIAMIFEYECPRCKARLNTDIRSESHRCFKCDNGQTMEINIQFGIESVWKWNKQEENG